MENELITFALTGIFHSPFDLIDTPRQSAIMTSTTGACHVHFNRNPTIEYRSTFVQAQEGLDR